MPTRFGATDHPICPKCKNLMRLTRRGPHPFRGYDFELQRFTCRGCQHEIERDADRLGEVAS
jgi:transposase-like protein